MFKRLCEIVRSTTFMKALNGWLTVVWIFMIPVSIYMGWIYSLAYISSLSIYAVVMGHWATWQTARVEKKQDEKSNS